MYSSYESGDFFGEVPTDYFSHDKPMIETNGAEIIASRRGFLSALALDETNGHIDLPSYHDDFPNSPVVISPVQEFDSGNGIQADAWDLVVRSEDYEDVLYSARVVIDQDDRIGFYVPNGEEGNDYTEAAAADEMHIGTIFSYLPVDDESQRSAIRSIQQRGHESYYEGIDYGQYLDQLAINRASVFNYIATHRQTLAASIPPKKELGETNTRQIFVDVDPKTDTDSFGVVRMKYIEGDRQINAKVVLNRRGSFDYPPAAVRLLDEDGTAKDGSSIDDEQLRLLDNAMRMIPQDVKALFPDNHQ